MKLSLKLSLAMGFLTILLCIVGIFSLYQMSRINNAAGEIADRWLPSVTTALGMNAASANYRIQEVMHIYSTDAEEMRHYSDRMDEVMKKFNEFNELYAVLDTTPEERKVYADFLGKWKRYQDIHAKIFDLSRLNKTAEAVAILTTDSRAAYNEASKALNTIVQLNREGSDAANANGGAVYDSSVSLITWLLVLAVAISVLLTFFIVRGVLKQLGKDPGELGVLARRVTEGDYNIDDGSQKIGVFGNLVAMVAALKEHIDSAQRESERAAEESKNAQIAMGKAEEAGAEAQAKTEAMLKAADKLEEVANIVSSASSELSAQIEQSERGASEQAARVAETATAMEEMNSTVLEVARNAGSASDVSAKTREKADGGAAIVKKAVDAIRQVQEESLALKGDMVTLGEHAQSISRIMSVISDIADQTNLLALNAAIEAARAGEAGRGFAVVADEVRKLAEKTMASTTDVGDAIKAIQGSADKSMAQVDRAVKTIEEATDFANRSGEALSEIVGMVDNAADQVRAIATASEQQSASSEEISQSINQVNTIAGETARAMEEAARAVSDLAGQAQVLSGLIEDMKRN